MHVRLSPPLSLVLPEKGDDEKKLQIGESMVLQIKSDNNITAFFTTFMDHAMTSLNPHITAFLQQPLQFSEKKLKNVLYTTPLLIAKFKDGPSIMQNFLAAQSLPVEVGIDTAFNTIIGALMGAVIGKSVDKAASLNPQAVTFLQNAKVLAGGPLVQARNFAVMRGVFSCLSCGMKRRKGREDMHSRVVAAFGSGAMFALVSGWGGSTPVANAVTSGLFFAIFHGATFQIGEFFKKSAEGDYAKTSSMLATLGLKTYEKNFMKGLLTDSTLPLLTDSALNDVKIPAGARLLILDHIKVEEKFTKALVEDLHYTKIRSMLTNLGLETYEKNFKSALLTDNTLPLLTESVLKDAMIPLGPRVLILAHIEPSGIMLPFNRKVKRWAGFCINRRKKVLREIEAISKDIRRL